jgi:hypothetical protein
MNRENGERMDKMKQEFEQDVLKYKFRASEAQTTAPELVRPMDPHTFLPPASFVVPTLSIHHPPFVSQHPTCTTCTSCKQLSKSVQADVEETPAEETVQVKETPSKQHIEKDRNEFDVDEYSSDFESFMPADPSRSIQDASAMTIPEVRAG